MYRDLAQIEITVLYKDELRTLYVDVGSREDPGSFWMGENGNLIFDNIDSRSEIYKTFGTVYWESVKAFKEGKDKQMKDLFGKWIFTDPDTNEPIDEEDDDEVTEKLKQEIRDENKERQEENEDPLPSQQII